MGISLDSQERNRTELKQQVKVDGRSTLLRKKFVLRGPVRLARLYVTGLDIMRLRAMARVSVTVCWRPLRPITANGFFTTPMT